ncbi:MAG: 6-bladed beta-propeller [Tannerella sp.]|jgi:hypothetical protein|nr:6-bladed beta-propeller [Tannerella sp.]
MKSIIYRLFFLYAVTILFWECNKPKNTDNITNNSITNITFDYQTNCLPFDSLFDDVFFVKLETTTNSLIGRISQILFVDGKIIVVDNEVAQNILVFAESGKFQNQIGTTGGGPMEYSRINCVALHPDNSMIAVNDNTKQLKYYAMDGTFVKSSALPYETDNIEFLTDKIIVSDCPSGNQINKNEIYKVRFIISDISGKVYHSGFECFYSNNFTYTTQSPVKKFGNNIFYNPSYSDTIYRADLHGVMPVYVFKMRDIPSLKIDKNINNKILFDHHEKYPFFNGEWFDLENTVYVTFMASISSWERFALYDKKQKKSFCCSGSLVNPVYLLWHTPKARYKDNYLVSAINAAELLSLKDKFYALKQNLPKGKENMLDDLFRDLTEDENPVLFFYRVNIRQNDK